MTRFTVIPEALDNAASSIGVDSSGAGTLPSGSLAGAATSTPLDGAWSAFLGDAIGTATTLDTVSIDLAGALRIASGNYVDANSCSADGLRRAP